MAARRKKSSGGSKGRVIDFTKAVQPEGGGSVRWPEDDYLGKIIGGKAITSSDKGTPGIMLVFQVQEGKKKGKKISERFWLSPKALPRLMDLIEACGKKPPAKASVEKIIKALTGSVVGFTLVDDEYEGKVRSQMAYDFLSKDDFEDDDDEDETDEDELDEDDDDEDEEDLDDMDRAELKAYIKENELEVKVKKSMDDDDIRAAILEAEEEDDDDDDEEDDDSIEDLDLDDL